MSNEPKTLRDEFAMAAMQALVALDRLNFDEITSYAYQIADEMMLERAKEVQK